MSKRVAIAKVGAAALAGAVALAASLPAQAQSALPPSGSYSAYSGNGYYYDPCKRDAAQRGTAGALIGGGMGAVIGSNAAARNARTEGALLGGLVGAIAGGVIGNKTAACTSGQTYNAPPPPPPPRADSGDRYYDRDAYAGRSDSDRDAYAARSDADRDSYAGRSDDRRYGDDDSYAYDRRGDRYRLSDRTPDPDGCTLAESPIYMPDGRTQMRYVRVCRDSTGRYAVVD